MLLLIASHPTFDHSVHQQQSSAIRPVSTVQVFGRLPSSLQDSLRSVPTNRPQIPVTPDPRPPQSNSLRYLHLLSLRRFRAIGYHSSTSMAFLIASLTTFDSRLRRIEHLLSPPLASADDNDAPATTSETEPQTLQSLVARLAALDKSVNTLLAGIDVNAIQNVIPPSSLTSEEEDLSIEQKRAIITSPNTPDIRQITSNLHTLQSLLPIPTVLPLTSSASPSNTATAQRLTDLRRKLEEDAAMSNQLRRRTVEVLEVYAQGVQEVNEWWVGVEQRGKIIERGLRAKEDVEY
ncbi:hypothetical protein SAICODRAFT_22188 [Saitoella complicata NRRL Y-17804]|uniref:uncharacterized protein n=1 Tax=Saitoella complicata (strain BCRC 22490 / CBS 7301 / JCM 7358 / NBRC 10748 / NRRL Y-17804) TaxID=698492 RepID=UPI0008668E55|nr:uncharacterized protein SAICODRAFT_22188 [Saitoella complicata NRRL Y-17804]ODQ49782.1 hypothetical protein SAICODRAFT_22188 [Saitoella complicata NRRL Y-17804]